MKLKTGIFVNALMRAAEMKGGSLTILTSGDREAGGLIVVCAHRGVVQALRERSTNIKGEVIWLDVAFASLNDPNGLADYLKRRQQFDADIWQIELDIVDATRFIVDFTTID